MGAEKKRKMAAGKYPGRPASPTAVGNRIETWQNSARHNGGSIRNPDLFAAIVALRGLRRAR